MASHRLRRLELAVSKREPVGCDGSLNSEGLDYKSGNCPTRELLLSGDQISVPNGVGFETAIHYEIRAFCFSRFVLYPERLNSLADEFIRKLFLRVGEARPGLSFHQKLVIDLRLHKDARGVTKHERDL